MLDSLFFLTLLVLRTSGLFGVDVEATASEDMGKAGVEISECGGVSGTIVSKSEKYSDGDESVSTTSIDRFEGGCPD